MQLCSLVCMLLLTVVDRFAGLRIPNSNDTKLFNKIEIAGQIGPSVADVVKLRTQLTGVASSIKGMLRESSPLAETNVAPALRSFLEKLDSVLEEPPDTKDPSLAMKSLLAARESLWSMTQELTRRQEALMREAEQEHNSLILGVLMTRQKEPMSQQLGILRSSEFKDLAVSKALLANHSDAKPLFVQAAALLDGMNGQEQNAVVGGVVPLGLVEVVHRLGSLSDSTAVDAVHNGDVNALKRAEAVLMVSLKGMKLKTGGLPTSFRLTTLLQKDCPYCTAQCVDKCHSSGHSYVECLSQCADAGKGK